MSETKKAVTAVDKATKGLNKAAGDLSKVMELLTTLVASSENLAFDIESKQGEMDSIGVKITESEREAQADLKIAIKENEDQVLLGLLADRGLANISTDEVESLSRDLVTAQRDNEEAISKAVADSERSSAISYNAQKSQLQAQQSVETAELKAKNEALVAKVNFLEESVSNLNKMLDDEREARVQMSANSSSPIVNVSGVK